MNNTYFITGIGTDVGKTIAAAIITESLKADYWKPIQAGDLENSDSMKLENLISNEESFVYPEGVKLKSAMSPHAAAELDGVKLIAKKIQRPDTSKDLVIEGAGGLLVPINSKETIANLILPTDKVILVSKHYLGSINHTLLSIEVLKSKGFSIAGILFNGDENKTTEKVVLEMTGIKFIGRIDKEPYFDRNVIKEYADRFRDQLQVLK
ncbi:dethiobiotin synthetase [Gillisia sp. Hel_I_86]|uniref:dethiobiotin synthase n=1 Tax=Gillisia sp. Hel_I_86 TaxID=1249981 RepID=UPI00119BEDCF|nr:dethiobiotin synthase [Gillisia sp. Hel_I_86]TVZ26482.1 dethiobiotin synthetase [Gillisia sp. Hel_I_86]